MDNAEIAKAFEELADLLEFEDENPFRIRAYRNGARAIRDLDEPVADIVSDPRRDLTKVPGIGKTLVDKTKTLLAEGKLPQLEKLRAAVPHLVIQMARIPGLGAKKAAALYANLDIETLDELRDACHEHRVADLKGFGAKTEKAILSGLKIAEGAAERIYWAEGDELASSIGAHMAACDAVEQLEWAGSYRRGRETIGDLDLLVVASDRSEAMDHLESYSNRSTTIVRGDTKISIRVNATFQVDMRVVDADQFGAALQYFTGSQAHNIHTRRLAKSRGLKINEYGVFREDNETRVAGSTEEDVYESIGLDWIPPELREDRGEIEAAANGELPDLIQLSDLRGDLHMHTTATDGKSTLREMADGAVAQGLSYIAITDHSQRVSMAGGLDPARLREQWQSIDEIQPEYEGRLQILKGIECDILENGAMDLPDDCLEEADWVLASIHYGQRQSRERITERIIGAIEHPHVDCIAHPTGRLLNRRPAYEVDMDRVIEAAREYGKLLELNSNPARLDLNDVHLAAAKRQGVRIVINTDAHSVARLNVSRYGIKQARRGGLTRGDVLNTRPWNEIARR